MDTFEPRQPRLAGTNRDAAPRREASGTAPSVPLVTRAEYDAYVEELVRLHEIRDRDLPDLLREARTFAASDAAEEMIQIHSDHGVNGARISRLEELVRTARIVDVDFAPHIVTLGRSVQVEHLRTGRIATYRLAGVASPTRSGTVSARSPVGAALMGRSPGDVVAIELPRGRTEELRVLAVSEEQQAA